MRIVVIAAGLGLLLGCQDKKQESPEPTQPEATAVDPAPPAPPVPPPRETRVTRLENVGFARPESVLHDTERDLYLVSNINGDPFAADGNGFISLITPVGKVHTLKFIDGAAEGVTLNAPKGMAILGSRLYVADLGVVRVFDKNSGKPVSEISIPKPHTKTVALNDIAVAGNAMYVSDFGLGKGFKRSGTDAIYKIDQAGVVTPLVVDKELGGPNGLYYANGVIHYATYRSGELGSVTEAGEVKPAETLPKGSLDGLESLGGGLMLVSSWEGQTVFLGKAGGPWRPFINGVESPADIGLDIKRTRVLVPLFNKNIVEYHPLP